MPAEPFTVHIAASTARDEATITDLLVDVIAFRMDRFLARAFDIPPQLRHPKHDDVFDKCTGLVIYLTGPVRYGAPECGRAILAILPGFFYLLGSMKFTGFIERKTEWEELTRLADVLKLRTAADGGASCRQCLLPLPCRCAVAKRA